MRKLGILASTAVLAIIGYVTINNLTQTENYDETVALNDYGFLKASEFLVDAEKAFLNFIAKYGKSYNSKSSHFKRFQTFRSNLDKIMRHNKDKPSFEMGINRFSDMSEEEFLNIYGTLKEHDEISQSRNLDSEYLARPHRNGPV